MIALRHHPNDGFYTDAYMNMGVALVTGKDFSGEFATLAVAEAKEAGVTAFCFKPLFLSELRSILTAPYKKIVEAEEQEASTQFLAGKKALLVDSGFAKTQQVSLPAMA